MKTDTLKGEYKTGASEVEDSTNNAMAMLGTGYDQPTIIIEPPKTVISRQNGRMVEIEQPAWVKFSTAFKKELKELDVYSLKVFLYIGLSVNWKTGEACPGVRLIAEETGMNKGTVVIAVANLEKMGFLNIQRRQGNSNIYQTVRYISVGTVRQERTLVSGKKGEVSGEVSEVSGVQEGNLHNKKNKNKLDIAEIVKSANQSMDKQIKFMQGRTENNSWTHRDKFSFNSDILVFADLCANRFGEPSKKDLPLWILEIGSWVDSGARAVDWPAAVEIVGKYTTPVISITGMTKAVKFAAQERKNGNPSQTQEPYHPEWEKVKDDPNEGKYVPVPAELRRKPHA